MSREEFMRELDYLLSDIPDEEKADAVGYYRDYLEEAGSENEDHVIAEFGSPERIAAIIRSELAGNLEEGGEFTESGYQDVRFKDPNFQVANRFELPEAAEAKYKETEPGRGRESRREAGSPGNNQTVKVILWIILVIVAAPVIFSLFGGLIGIAGGIFGCLVAAIVVIGVLTVVFLLVGVILFIVGVGYLVVSPPNGLLLIGAGILLLGIGLLGVALCIVFYGRFLPFLIRTVVNFFNGLIHRKGKEV